VHACVRLHVWITVPESFLLLCAFTGVYFVFPTYFCLSILYFCGCHLV